MEGGTPLCLLTDVQVRDAELWQTSPGHSANSLRVPPCGLWLEPSHGVTRAIELTF